MGHHHHHHHHHPPRWVQLNDLQMVGYPCLSWIPGGYCSTVHFCRWIRPANCLTLWRTTGFLYCLELIPGISEIAGSPVETAMIRVRCDALPRVLISLRANRWSAGPIYKPQALHYPSICRPISCCERCCTGFKGPPLVSRHASGQNSLYQLWPTQDTNPSNVH